MARRAIKQEHAIRRSNKRESAADLLSGAMKFIRHRFQFNIQQIEKRYANKSSGLVHNLQNDTLEFDPEESSARNEKDLLESVKREFNHAVDKYGGAGMLSTPAEDPDEKDGARISNWNKLNRLFTTFQANAERQEVKAIESSGSALRKIKREIKRKSFPSYRTKHPRLDDAPSAVQYANEVFGRRVKQEAKSVAESHVIEEPIVQPLMPSFQTLRQVKKEPPSNKAHVMTRAQKRRFAIEQSYDDNEDQVYAPGTDWVDRWVLLSTRVKSELKDF